VQFRLTHLLSAIAFIGSIAGCASATSADPPAPEEAPLVAASPEPVVGTWLWTASGTRIGDIELGEEKFVFRDDGTYAVLSSTPDGTSECYEGTFTWSNAGEPGYGTIVFKGSHVHAASGDGFERDVRIDGTDTLVFQEGGTYRRTGPVLDIRCP
jgi:hypothetical protein